MDEEDVCLITIKFIFKRWRIKNESKQKYCKNERGLVVSTLFAEGAVPSYRRGARYRTMAGSHPTGHPSGEVLGANGRSGCLHADRLFGSVSPGAAVSAADAPLLLWELVWKSIWLIVVALPLWSAGQMDESTLAMASACLMVVIVPFVIPWRFVFEHYVKKHGDRWR